MTQLTVFRTADGRPANKIVSATTGGGVKRGMAPHAGRYVTRTVGAPDVHALAAILREVGERADTCISLSLFKDTPEGEFVVVPAKELAARLGVEEYDREALAGFHEIDGEPTTARIKQSMALDSWILFDRDAVSDMPTELADLDFAEWREAVGLLFPGFDRAGCVVVPSTSTRVTVDGAPLASRACHVFVLIDDPADLNRAWRSAAARALITEYRGVPLGFPKPIHSRATGEVIGTSDWTIYDKSVAAVARLVFDGAPVVRGAGLAVLPPVVEVHEGPALELRRVRDLAPRKEIPLIEAALEQIRGVRPKVALTKNRTGKVTGVELVIADLTLEQELDTERGRLTVGALQTSGAGHIRCQSPFRESTSWAAYYNCHRDGAPFVFDSGTGEKHVLARTGLATMAELIQAWLIEAYRPQFICRDGKVYSEAAARRLTVRDIVPTSEILDRLVMASDAPCDDQGQVKRLALPAQFRSWLPVAWGDLLGTLPTEDETTIVGPDEFIRHLTTLLTSMVRLGIYGVETRSLGSWAYAIAVLNPGDWCRVGDLELWGRITGDGFLLAIRPGLALQTSRPVQEIGELSLSQLTRRCRKHGIALDGDNRISCESRQTRAVILTAEFVASLELSYARSDPLAAALRARLGEESTESAEPPEAKARRRRVQ